MSERNEVQYFRAEATYGKAETQNVSSIKGYLTFLILPLSESNRIPSIKMNKQMKIEMQALIVYIYI